MATKTQMKALQDKLDIANEISDSRFKALQVILQTPHIAGYLKEKDPQAFHQCDLAARAMREGRTPSGNRLVEVAIGTPASCDPTTELYWSM